MSYVQKTVFSSDGISQDIVNLMGAVGDTAVKHVFENARKRELLEGLMKQVLESKFIKIESNINDNPNNKIPYQSMEKALKQLFYFTVDSPFYATEEIKRKKLFNVLESVTFVEANALFRLLSGKFDKQAVRHYFNPPKPKRVVVEKEPTE